jgi:hypothetical protein
MVLYKFKEPKQAEDKPKTESRKTSDSKDSEDSAYHYDYMKQLMKQKNGTKSTKATEESKKSKNGPFCLTKYDLQPFVEVSVLLVVIICIMFVAVFLLSDPDNSDTDVAQVEQTATVESHSEVVSEYSSFEGMQENGLPKKWVATVNKDHKYIDFSDLAKEYEYRDIARSLSFTVTEGDECIVESIYDVGFQTSWPAYDLCNDSNTKTYNLTVHVSDSDEIGTVQLVLTVEK